MAIQKGPTWFIAIPKGQASRKPGKASADLPAPRLCGAGLRLPHVELAKLIPAKADVISTRLLAERDLEIDAMKELLAKKW